MLFNSYQFLIFFPVVVGVFFVIPKKVRYLWLLVASYFFYMSWNPKYALLLAFSTLVTWASGLALAKVNEKQKAAEAALTPGDADSRGGGSMLSSISSRFAGSSS